TFRQRCAVAQEPDNWSLRRLLRARREGPRRRAAEQRDEIAPLHSITSSARASSGSGTFRYGPNVLPGPTRFSHRHDPLHQPRLLAPEAHVHLAIHRRRGGQTLPSLLWLAGAAIELAQAQMAVGDKRAHAVRLGERQRLLVVSYAAFSIELVG